MDPYCQLKATELGRVCYDVGQVNSRSLVTAHDAARTII